MFCLSNSGPTLEYVALQTHVKAQLVPFYSQKSLEGLPLDHIPKADFLLDGGTWASLLGR